MTTSNLLAQLFPASAAAVPEQFQLGAPIEQRDYLVDGQLQVWNGPLAKVQSPVQFGDERVHIGSTPLLDAETGEVVGVVNMVLVKGTKESALSQPTGISYAIPARFVEDLIGRK